MVRAKHEHTAHPGPAEPEEPIPVRSPAERLAVWVLLAGLIIIPIWYSPTGRLSFRLPKLLLLHGEGIILLSLLLVSDDLRQRLKTAAAKRWLLLPAAVLAWSLISAIGATAIDTLISSLLTVASCCVIFAAAYAVAPALNPSSLYAMIVPAVVHAALAMLQRVDIWFPLVPTFRRGMMTDPYTLRVAPIALLGNRNDLGIFLLLPTILALGLLITSPKRKLLHASLAAFLLAGLLASNTLTAMLALGAALIAGAALHRPRTLALTAVALVIVGTVAVTALPPLRQRAASLATAAKNRNFDALITYRTAAYLAAVKMAVTHPITGVGPGQFAIRYFDAKIAASRAWPTLAAHSGSADSFGEAHNDHLQIAAEFGFPGYVLFLSGIVVIAAVSFRRPKNGERSLVELTALPFATAVAVAALAQFPMQIAATLVHYATFAALCAHWRSE